MAVSVVTHVAIMPELVLAKRHALPSFDLVEKL